MNVLVNDKDIQEIKYFGKEIGNGREGNCYLLENNLVYKIFSNSKDRPDKINFANLKCSQISFPIDVLYDKRKNLVGYTMKYLSGEKLIKGFRDELEIKTLKKVYLEMRLFLLKLRDIYMFDMCLKNMLYDYNFNKINLIDTSRWYEKNNSQIENINEFNWQMTTALLRNIDFKHYKLNHDKSLNDMYLTYKFSEDRLSIFIEFLNELENKVSEYKGEKVKTIKDLKI